MSNENQSANLEFIATILSVTYAVLFILMMFNENHVKRIRLVFLMSCASFQPIDNSASLITLEFSFGYMPWPNHQCLHESGFVKQFGCW